MTQTSLTSLFETFVERGFGTLTKKEIERLVYAQMVDSGWLRQPDEVFDASRKLRISPQKAAALRYEYRLHRASTPTKDVIRVTLAEVIENTRFRGADSKSTVLIEIRDRLAREQIEEFLLKQSLGTPIDYTFNRNLLQFDMGTFSELILMLADAGQLRKVEERLKSAKQLPAEGITKELLVKAFAEGAAKNAGGLAVEYVASLLVPTSGISKLVNCLSKHTC
ncbi:MAG TPA: hypothetical protein PLT48_15285 [Nitrospira sp.]|nr:hypothetical protein [Nitrospira sp.]